MKEYNLQIMKKNKFRGIITIAQGSNKYINMAKNLGYSLLISNPDISRTVVTDSDDKELCKLYDNVILINKCAGIGTQQKLLIYDYSPYDETIFIDCDCLVIKDIDFLWNLFSRNSVGVIGSKFYDYEHWGISVDKLKDNLSLDYLLRFNGGLYYFKKDNVARQVYEVANFYLNHYKSIGINDFRGGINEEPLMSISMSLAKIDPVDDDGKGMYTPIGIRGSLKIDSLKGFCKFDKEGLIVEPSVIHFCGDFSAQFHYLREIFKVKLFLKTNFSKSTVSALVDGVYNVPYALFIFTYRVYRFFLRRQSFKINPVLPVVRSW